MAQDAKLSAGFRCPDTCPGGTLLRKLVGALKPDNRTCVWRGVPVSLLLLHEPELPWKEEFAEWSVAGEQTEGWFDAVQHDPSSGLDCSPSARANASSAKAMTLLLAESRVRHWLPSQGARRCGGDAACAREREEMLRTVHDRLCAYFTHIRTVLWRRRVAGERPVILLNVGGEPLTRTLVSSIQATLASCGINPADAIGLHSNLGAMLPLDHHVKDRHHWRPFQDFVDAHLRLGQHLRKPALLQAALRLPLPLPPLYYSCHHQLPLLASAAATPPVPPPAATSHPLPPTATSHLLPRTCYRLRAPFGYQRNDIVSLPPPRLAPRRRTGRRTSGASPDWRRGSTPPTCGDTSSAALRTRPQPDS